jgi:hypothetical protein
LCKNLTRSCWNHTWVCILKKFKCLSNNIFKKWHVCVWISYAIVSFSHVCVLYFFETQFITLWNESNKNICSNIRKTTLNVYYGIVFHLFMLWYFMINVSHIKIWWIVVSIWFSGIVPIFPLNFKLKICR